MWFGITNKCGFVSKWGTCNCLPYFVSGETHDKWGLIEAYPNLKPTQMCKGKRAIICQIHLLACSIFTVYFCSNCCGLKSTKHSPTFTNGVNGDSDLPIPCLELAKEMFADAHACPITKHWKTSWHLKPLTCTSQENILNIQTIILPSSTRNKTWLVLQ